MAFGDDLAPRFALTIDGGAGDVELHADITQHVISVEFEEAAEYIAKGSVVVDNTNDRFSDSRVFQAGNELSISMGYGRKLQHVGRVVLERHLPKFPSDGVRTLEIVGYDPGYRMQKVQPTKKLTRDEKKARTARAKLFGRKVQEEPASIWRGVTHGEIVTEKAEKYGMEADVDGTLELHRQVIQPRDMSDYQIVRGLANVNGRDFWIDWDTKKRKWILHWRDARKLRQAKTYTFRYDQGAMSSLISFEPEFALDQQRTAVEVISVEAFRAKVHEEVSEEDVPAKEDPRFVVTQPLETPIESGARLLLAIGEHSVEVITDRTFENVQDAQRFAERWLRERQDDFVVGQGETIGVEDLRAFDVHQLQGIGQRYNGPWFFSVVRHKFAEGGYTTGFSARRVAENNRRLGPAAGLPIA